ncbi:MAG: hypothetical protein AAF682_26955 [Planctomycetota bacterium]
MRRSEARRSALAWGRSTVLALLVSACGGGTDFSELGPPPEGAGWHELAEWAAAGYRHLGFELNREEIQVHVRPERDPAELIDVAAHSLAAQIREVAPRQHADTRWMLRRTLGLRAAASPEEQLAEDARALLRSTPLWYDRRTRVIHVLEHHPVLQPPATGVARHGPQAERWHLMAHEVAHLLQDQRSSLRELTERGTYEGFLLHQCLLEGEAELRSVALALRLEGRELTGADLDACVFELRRLYARSEPSLYEAGFRHLFRVFQEGGWDAVDQAVLDPHVTTRDLLDGGGRTAGALEVTLPPWPALGAIEPVWEDVLGAWGLLVILGPDYPSLERLAELTELALAWRGDRLAVGHREDGQPVLVWRLVFADEAAGRLAAQSFAGAEGTVAHRGAVVDFVWTSMPAIERELLERLHRHPAPGH